MFASIMKYIIYTTTVILYIREQNVARRVHLYGNRLDQVQTGAFTIIITDVIQINTILFALIPDESITELVLNFIAMDKPE